jgi:outer membrane immunogenic protein
MGLGMKKLLLGSAAFFLLSAGAALATDMPIKAPVYKAVEPVYDWSGLYVGVYSGVGAQQSRGKDPTGGAPGELDYTGSGFTGGGTLGYNWQFGRNWVAGLEGDIGYLGLSHQVRDWNDTFNYNSKTSWLATARGRVGYSNGPTLNYITAGGAWVHAADSVSNLAGTPVAESSKTDGGFVVGSGVETMLGGNWTAKAEYLYVDVGKGASTLLPGSVFNVQVDHRYSLMRFGLNYLFGAKPQPTLPAYNWGGFYAGIVGGTALTEERASDPTGAVPGQIGNNADGLTVGGIAGYNWQFARNWAGGVEGDFSYFGVKRDVPEYNDFGNGARNAMLDVKTDWLATARGRFGYTAGPAFLYVTGGGAWINLRDSWQGASGAAAGPLVASTKTLSGYAVGGGIESVVSGNWVSRTEYLFADVGAGAVLASTASMRVDEHKYNIFRSTLTYRFGTQ